MGAHLTSAQLASRETRAVESLCLSMIREWMTRAVKPGPFSPPGLVVAVNDAVEVCGVDGAGVPLSVDAVWPLTCLTKLALADLAVKHLPLDAPITDWLPEVSPVSIRALLTHTAGLPLDLPGDLYGVLDAEGVRRATLAVRPTLPPGAMSYSNIGYGWISMALERQMGWSLRELWAAYGLCCGADVIRPVAISDISSPHAGTALEPIQSGYWRSLALPWAGAFGTLTALRKLFDSLDPRVCSVRIAGSGGFPAGAFFGCEPGGGCVWDDVAWGCGVEFRGTKRPHWITPNASPESYGHMGSSGILIWRDGNTTFLLAGPRRTEGGWMLRHGPKASGLAFTTHAGSITPELLPPSHGPSRPPLRAAGR